MAGKKKFKGVSEIELQQDQGLWFTVGGLAIETQTPESTIRYWTGRNLLDHRITTTGQRIYPASAAKQARGLRARRGA